VTFGFGKLQDESALVRLGTEYGGWWCPSSALKDSNEKILISAGLGYDTTFDALMLQNGFQVIGLDPLSDCCVIATRDLAGLGDFKILNAGISTFTGIQSFYQPRNPSHDAWSTINAQESKSGIQLDFDVISIADLKREFITNSNSKFNYLKMDIEGAELALFNETIDEFSDFDFIGAEMDFLSLIPFLSFSRRISRVRNARKVMREFEHLGFYLIHHENFNFFWQIKK
jgi:FkbM family methyltransferase